MHEGGGGGEYGDGDADEEGDDLFSMSIAWDGDVIIFLRGGLSSLKESISSSPSLSSHSYSESLQYEQNDGDPDTLSPQVGQFHLSLLDLPLLDDGWSCRVDDEVGTGRLFHEDGDDDDPAPSPNVYSKPHSFHFQ